MFGDDVDLTATSPLRKILEVTAAEDAGLWRRLEDLYYARFLSSAVGDDLDLLGEDVGVRAPVPVRATGAGDDHRGPAAGRAGSTPCPRARCW